jgi:hypothetical protein
VAVLVVIASCSPSASAPTATGSASAEGRVAAWHDDLGALVTALGHHPRPFFHTDETAWRRDVAQLDAAIPTLDDRHVIAGLVRLAAALGDSHTRLYPPRDVLYPVRFLGFEDGIFVAGADTAAQWAVGKRVVAIEGKPIDQALARLTPLVAAENPAFLAGELPSLLENPAATAGTDVSRDHQMTVTVDGGSAALELAAGRGVALAPPKPLPLHLDGPFQYAYWNKYVAAQRLLYFQYNACKDDDRVGPFATFAAGTLAFVDQHQVDRFVVDLRSNQGGNSAILEPLIAGLASRPALAGRVFVLIGRTTFSSAVIAASELATRVGATLVGTPTGGNPNGYGEIKMFELPHSHLVGQYSTKLFADASFPGKSIEPDVLVHVKADDWFAGRDPAMDAVLAAAVPAAPRHRP